MKIALGFESLQERGIRLECQEVGVGGWLKLTELTYKDKAITKGTGGVIAMSRCLVAAR